MSRRPGSSARTYRRNFHTAERTGEGSSRRRATRYEESSRSTDSMHVDPNPEINNSRGRREGKAPENPFAHRSMDGIYTTPASYRQRYEQVRQTLNRNRVMKFGITELPVLGQNDPAAFRPLSDLPVDQQQRTLLNALWKAKSKRDKHQALNALQYYFSKIMTPPMGKSFSFYALVRGGRKGIYYYYQTLCATIGDSRNCHWKGFYSFEEAYDFLLEYCEEDDEIFIEKEGHGALAVSLEEEIDVLKKELSEGRGELYRLERLLEQQLRRKDLEGINFEDFKRKMTLIPSFRTHFLTELLQQRGGRDCCDYIYILAQSSHYNELRNLQKEILVLPYIKDIPIVIRLTTPWMASCQRTSSKGLEIFSEYSPITAEIQLLDTENPAYSWIVHKLEEYYWKGMVSAIFLHEAVPTPMIFGETINNWIDAYRKKVCFKKFCTIHVYSSFPQYQLFHSRNQKASHSKSAGKDYFGKFTPSYRHLVLIPGHCRNIYNGKVPQVPPFLEDQDKCKRLFSTVSCHRIEHLPRTLFEYDAIEETNPDTGDHRIVNIPRMEMIDKTLVTTLWAERGALELINDSEDEANSIPRNDYGFSQKHCYDDGDNFDETFSDDGSYDPTED